MNLLVKQLEKPQGYIGGLINWALSKKQEELTEFVLKKLAIQGKERVLEVGFGSGRLLEKVNNLLDDTATLQGIDHSEVMFKQASERNEAAISTGQIQLLNTCLWDFQSLEDYFDTVYAVNVHIYWDNPVTEFRFMRELLREGGKLVIVFKPQSLQPDDDVMWAAYQAVEQYIDAGFDEVKVDYQESKGENYISVIGYK